MIYTTSEICNIVGGKLLGNHQLIVTQIVTDSRQLRSPEEVMFVALKGKFGDGHNYISQLLNNGVKIFLVNENFTKKQISDNTAFILVKNTLTALQQLAAHHRKQHHCPVIAITGSNGKTIVKEWLAQSLQKDKNVVRSPKSYNSQLGVPLSVLLLDPFADIAVFEAGISKPGEMEKLAQIILPDLGIFTNLGDAHQENFSSKEEKLREKIRLYETCHTILLSSNDTMVLQTIKETYTKKNIVTWGSNPWDTLQIMNIHELAEKTEIKVKYRDNIIELTIPFTDKPSIQNALLTALALLLLEQNPNIVRKRIAALERISMRMELLEGKNNCTLINDSYNSDLVSLASSFEYLSIQNQTPRKIAVVSDMEQIGIPPEKLYAEVANLVKHFSFDFIGIGPQISTQKHLFPETSQFLTSTAELIHYFQNNPIHNSTILFKGSRNFRFENVVDLLQKKIHRTVLEIDLNNLIANLRFFRSLLNPGTKIIVMLKAFGYGSGSFELANILQHHRVDYLAVAFTDEGIDLRRQGIKIPIMVMNPGVETCREIVEFNLEPVVFYFDFLKHFSSFLEQNNIETYPIHLKIDTGMNRSGFRNEDIDFLIRELHQNSRINVKSVFSHLAAADDPNFDSFTLSQIHSFQTICKQIQQHTPYPFLRHILNSAGVERFATFQMDAVRLGIGLYGVSFNQNRELLPVATLRSRILQIKEVTPPDTVGYGRKGVVHRPSKIATVPIGYADGYRRALSNGKGQMLLKGKLVPTIGNICMDITMIDVTNTNAQPGDEVIIFGHYPTIQQIAEAMDTIPYEVLTGISARVKRIYVRE